MDNTQKLRIIEEKLINGTPLTDFNQDELLQILTKPTLKAFYKEYYKNSNNPPKQVGKNEKIICDICNKSYTKHNRARHNKSQIHQAYYNINKKLHGIII